MSINIANAVDKAYEGKSLKEIADAPVSCLQGVSESQAKLLAELNIRTVRQLADWKYAEWARAIVTLASVEQ